jgi:simple sugar transport system ATP-binding protein
MMAERKPILQIQGLNKRFGDLVALDRADLRLDRGDFLAILGENGAGKSTLVKCVIGLYNVDTGKIEIDGQERPVDNPKDAQKWGVGMVHQHFSLVPNMIVAENFVLARNSGLGVIDWHRETHELEDFCSRKPFSVDLAAPASSLAAGEKQKVEILKQLYLGNRIMILDEPTSLLTMEEADELFSMLLERTQRGDLSMRLITHLMNC